MTTRIIVAAVVLLMFKPAVAFCAGEHPEHPQSPPATQPSDQMKPATTKVEKKEVTTAQISTGIKKNITAQTNKSSDKKFHTKHQGKDLALDLVKVHDDRLSGLGGGKYFACVDMKAADGTVYDIDFFLAGTPDNMTVTETSVHKVNGKALYSWKEEGGVWKKVPAA
jgi:hypothetical protein